MSEILKKLGIEADSDEHPADAAVLKSLGLAPEPDEHPATTAERDWGGSTPVTSENRGTPQAPRDRAMDFYRATRPETVIPAIAKDVGSNILEYGSAGASRVGQGLQDIVANRPASGVGNVGLGALQVATSPVAGAVKSGENALTKITGNPDFAEKAALLAPVRVGGPVAKTAAHNIAPSTKAADLVAERMTPADLERLKTNPRLRPMDVSKGVRDLGVGIAKDTSQPRAMSPVVSSMERSAATAKDAVRGTYDEALGAPPNLFEEYQRLENKAKAIGQAKIAPPLIAAKPVDTSSVLTDMDKALNPVGVKMSPGTTITPSPLQQKLAEMRQKLASGDQEVLTSADRLHSIQSDWRREAEDLMSSATGSDRKLGREMLDYRNKLVDSIDKVAPGYKEGLKAYRDQKDIERAFEFGRDVLKNTNDIKTDPSYLKQWVTSKDRTPEELAAARLGARQAIEYKMGSIKSAALNPGRSGTDIPEVDFNRQKLEHLFGKESTDKMFQHLRDERDIAVTNNRGLANSTTAEAQAAQEAIKPRDVSKPHSQLPNWAIGTGLAMGALTTNPTIGALTGMGLLGLRSAKTGYDYIGRQMDLSRNASLAHLISRNDPETISQLASAMSRIEKRNKLRNLIAPP